MTWLFLFSAAGAFILVGIMAASAPRFAMLDAPGPRSSHDVPTPTGAGVALITALWLACGLYLLLPGTAFGDFPAGWLPLLLAPASLLCLVGFVDDRRSLSARLRLMVQLAVSLVLLAGLRNELSTMPWAVLPALLAVVWTMNAYNFMDGSNGLAGMQGLFSGLMLALCLLLAGAPELGLAAAALAGVCAGFLPWNTPRAKIFLGDAGSVPLGFLFAGLALMAYLQEGLPLPVLILSLMLFHIDAGLTLLSRIRNKEQWYTAHRRHVYQRLLTHGWTHGQVLLLFTAINGLIVAPAMVLGTFYGDWSWVILASVTTVLSLTWYAVSLKLGEGT